MKENDPQNGIQRWYSKREVNYISYVEFNALYKIIHRVLINLEYGHDVLEGII